MDQIRNTMMQHEALFREQVQDLHKLYNIQILAMQEIRRRIYSHAQVLTLSSERVVLADDKFHGSILEGKPLTAHATARGCNEDSLALTLRPFLLSKEFKGSGSLWVSDRELENVLTAQEKQMRNFDLEKLPEDFMGEPEILVQTNNYDIVETTSILSQRTANRKENSVVEANLSSIKSESQSLKQMCPEIDLRLFTMTSQQFNQNGDQALESKAFENDVNKCITDSWNSNSSTPKNPIISYQVPSILESLQCNDNPKDSSNGSNSILTEDTMSCKYKNNSAYVEDTHGLVDRSCKKGQMSSDGGDVVDSDHQKLTQFLHDGTEHSFCLNREPETMSSLDKPAVSDNNQDETDKLAQREDSESIAAEILLSFAPHRKLVDSELHCSQTKAESGKSG